MLKFENLARIALRKLMPDAVSIDYTLSCFVSDFEHLFSHEVLNFMQEDEIAHHLRVWGAIASTYVGLQGEAQMRRDDLASRIRILFSLESKEKPLTGTNVMPLHGTLQ